MYDAADWSLSDEGKDRSRLISSCLVVGLLSLCSLSADSLTVSIARLRGKSEIFKEQMRYEVIEASDNA